MTKTQETPEKSKGSFKVKRERLLDNLDAIKTIPMKGKNYAMVVERQKHLLKEFPEARFNEEILFHDNERVIVKVELYIGDTIYSVGHAEEKRDANFINKTSALENASTSALGRCLATFGLTGSEFSSADELVNAIKNQAKDWSAEINKITTQTKLNKLFSEFETFKEKMKEEFTTKEANIKTQGGHNANKWE